MLKNIWKNYSRYISVSQKESKLAVILGTIGALSETFSRLDEKNITKFDGNFMDWEFVEDTVIWTGKGPRKYENQRYLKAKNDFNRLPSAPSNIWNKS